jgi:hypothetical protein
MLLLRGVVPLDPLANLATLLPKSWIIFLFLVPYVCTAQSPFFGRTPLLAAHPCCDATDPRSSLSLLCELLRRGLIAMRSSSLSLLVAGRSGPQYRCEKGEPWRWIRRTYLSGIFETDRHYKKKGKECRPKPHTLTEISRHSKYKSVG